ncbi:hypothetical protein COLO4_33903 [Corchorus olitorius]|uniref:Uncharacterized protein n=1 Tax=Corchorus olitorius TaxID=93759 RepID=A0A1R3GQ70_9ROSI|nr:hypothetical protein COLO4_33903 [Corchorus olitorius]
MGSKLHQNAPLDPLNTAPVSISCEYHRISLDLILPRPNSINSIGKSHRRLKPTPRELRKDPRDSNKKKDKER